MSNGVPFDDDVEKMLDFMELSKEDFLKSYSYLSEEDYEATKKIIEGSSQNDYKVITVRDILKTLISDPNYFSKGLDTAITTGDFEGNYTHRKHQIGVYGKNLFLGYEMHEGFND